MKLVDHIVDRRKVKLKAEVLAKKCEVEKHGRIRNQRNNSFLPFL